MGAVLRAVVLPMALTLAVAVALVLAVALGWACGLARLVRLVPHPRFDRASIVQSNALYADLQLMVMLTKPAKRPPSARKINE